MSIPFLQYSSTNNTLQTSIQYSQSNTPGSIIGAFSRQYLQATSRHSKTIPFLHLPLLCISTSIYISIAICCRRVVTDRGLEDGSARTLRLQRDNYKVFQFTVPTQALASLQEPRDPGIQHTALPEKRCRAQYGGHGIRVPLRQSENIRE
jgi:hypothetical protein